MGEQKTTAQLEEVNNRLEAKVKKLEQCVLKQAENYEKAIDQLEQQVAEKTLHFREQNKQMLAIIENVPGVVFQFYATNKGEAGVHYVSPKLTEIFGIEFIEDGALFFEKFSENIHDEDKGVWIESIGHVIEKQIPWKWKGRYVKTSGEIVWFQGHSLPTVREDEIVFDGLFIDITDKIQQERELKHAKEAAEAANNELERRVAERTLELQKTHERLLHAEKLSAIGRLSASIAHEFNNPLYGIKNVIESIKRNTTLNAGDQKLTELALSECERVQDLIKNLQDFNKPSSGINERVDIHALLDNMILMVKKEFKKANIIIKKQYAPDLPNVHVIQDQIKQVFLNLLTNAQDAITGEKGSVTITTENLKNSIAIRISDTGDSIDPNILPHIFEPFFTTKLAVKGTGLGLSVSYGIIKGHRGDLQVDSDPGNGTTFSVILPLKMDEDDETEHIVS